MAKLDHVALRVSDMDAAVAFYTEKLGLNLLFRKKDASHHEEFAFLELEGGNLELLASLDENGNSIPFEAPQPEKPYCPHVAIETQDMAELMNLAARKKIPVAAGPFEIGGEVRWVYLTDPDNNIIEFVQWLHTPAASSPIDG